MGSISATMPSTPAPVARSVGRTPITRHDAGISSCAHSSSITPLTTASDDCRAVSSSDAGSERSSSQPKSTPSGSACVRVRARGRQRGGTAQQHGTYETGNECGAERELARPARLAQRRRDGKALGYVVQRDRRGDADAHRRRPAANERDVQRHALGQVVQRQRRHRQQRHAHQAAVALACVLHLLARALARIVAAAAGCVRAPPRWRARRRSVARQRLDIRAAGRARRDAPSAAGVRGRCRLRRHHRAAAARGRQIGRAGGAGVTAFAGVLLRPIKPVLQPVEHVQKHAKHAHAERTLRTSERMHA